MNTLAYFKFNSITGEEHDHDKRNVWLLVRIEEGENPIDAITEMKLFSSVCEAEGFHVIGESVLIGNETGAEYFLTTIITRIPFIECIATPTIRSVAASSAKALSVVEKLQNEGVDYFTMLDGELFKASGAVTVLRAFHEKEAARNC